MKVYVVTAGCYSDYHIEAVFTDPVMANAFANINSEREVEEYEADSVKMAEAGIKARIRYSPKKNEIESIDTGDYVQERWRPGHDTYEYNSLFVYRKLSSRTLQDVMSYGKKSPILLKILQDAWAAYKNEHWIELEKEDKEEEVWLQATPEEMSKAFQKIAGMYNAYFTSTSGTTGDDDDGKN